MERVAPRLDVAKLIMPAPHVGKFRQWQFRAFGERQRRRHPEISVGYPFSEEPRAMFEIFVEGSRVLPKITRGLFQDCRVGLFIREGRGDDAIEIERIRRPRQMICAPTDPHDHFGAPRASPFSGKKKRRCPLLPPKGAWAL